MKLLIAAILLIFLGLQLRLWTGTGSFADVADLNDKVEKQVVDNGLLEERNDELFREVDELKTGMDAIEERARSELGLIKKGETFYLIVEEE